MEYLIPTLFVVAGAYFAYYSQHNRAQLHEIRTLRSDGFMIWNGSDRDVARMILGGDYVFLDYTYTIRGCALTTWHRDVTSGQRSWNTTHPTYTLIHYKSTGNLLSMVPGSHLGVMAFQKPVDIVSEVPNTMVLFNADMLHAGMPNVAGDARHAVQYKLAHRDDVARLGHLDGVDTVKDGRGHPTVNPWLVSTLRFLSFHGAFVSHQFGKRFMMRAYDDGFANWVQRWLPVRFYNNE